MTRIRYKKHSEPNTYITKRSILCNTIPVHIILNFTIMKWSIINKVTKEIITEGRSSTINQLKSKSKLATIKMGAQYLDELRNTKKRKRRLDI